MSTEGSSPSGLSNLFGIDWGKFIAGEQTTGIVFDPKVGTFKTVTKDGGFFTSDLAKGTQALYGVGMDAYNIYNTNRNYDLQKQQMQNQYDLGLKNYGLAATDFNNNVAGKNARNAAAKSAGISSGATEYKTV